MRTKKEERYNGWSNYETWNANLWMQNDQNAEVYWSAEAVEAYEEAESRDYASKSDVARFNLATAMQNDFENNNPLKGLPSAYSDLLQSAMDGIDWDEIADNRLRDVEGYVPQEQEVEL